jgi:hypothetical protein
VQYRSLVILDQLETDASEFARQTGWTLKPEGACRGDVCVPLPDDARTSDGRVAIPAVAERLRMPLLHDESHGVWSLGPASVTGRALATAEAAELSLPDLNGDLVSLESLRGQKVILVAWASW